MGGYTISEQADLMRITTHGAFSAAEIDELYARLARIVREQGAVYILIDARGGIVLDAAMRRQVAQLSNVATPKAIAIFGATLPQQAMLVLLSSAVQIVRGRRVPLRFSRSEAEAQSWLLSQRPVVVV